MPNGPHVLHLLSRLRHLWLRDTIALRMPVWGRVSVSRVETCHRRLIGTHWMVGAHDDGRLLLGVMFAPVAAAANAKGDGNDDADHNARDLGTVGLAMTLERVIFHASCKRAAVQLNTAAELSCTIQRGKADSAAQQCVSAALGFQLRECKPMRG